MSGDVRPLSGENLAAAVGELGEYLHPDMATAVAMDEWVPRTHKTVSELGLEVYRDYHVLHYATGDSGSDTSRTLWRCAVFGPPTGPAGDEALRLFEVVASEAARLILGGKGKGKCLPSGWLIRMAELEEPIHPRSGKFFLTWERPGGPWWCAVDPIEPGSWWAVRFDNVFQYSKDVIQKHLDLIGGAPSRVNKGDELSILGKTESEAGARNDRAFRLIRSGAIWEISGLGESGHLPHLAGITTLVQLLRSPDKRVSWAELLGAGVVVDRQGRHPVLDAEALSRFRAEERRLRQEIDEAENEAEKADSERALDALTKQGKKDLGLGGNPRELNTTVHRLRARVHGRLKKVYAKMREGAKPLSKLANHLECAITSSADGYVYNPPEPLRRWHLDPGEK